MRPANRRPRRAWLAPALVAALLAGCVSEEREQELGDRIAAELNPQLPLVPDVAINYLVTQLGQRIAAQTDRSHIRYRFYVVGTPEQNAFALPGGHVYVTLGLLHRTQSPEELAAVLAHEIGHVAARHGAQKLERHLRTGTVVSLLYHLLFGREPELLDRQALDLGRKLWSASHSRRDEREADALAVRYLHGAGLEPHGLLRLLEGLSAEEAESPGRHLAWFATHPLTADRVRWVRKEIARLPRGDPSLSGGDAASLAASFDLVMGRAEP